MLSRAKRQRGGFGVLRLNFSAIPQLALLLLANRQHWVKRNLKPL
jgi:hypothetical protein